MNRNPADRIRVLHAPLNICNDAWSLCRAQRELGADSRLAVLTQTRSSQPDYDLSLRNLTSVPRQWAKARFVVEAIRQFDVFHFSFARSILDYGQGPLRLLDLKLAALLGRCVVMTYHGCDILPAIEEGCRICAEQTRCSVSAAERRLRTLRRFVDLSYVTTPDLLKIVPEARLLPVSVWELSRTEVVPPRLDGTLRIVHAPTDRQIKGTEYIEAAVRDARASGLDIDLHIVEGLPHGQACEVYRTADLIIDQVRRGWYGTFAVETAAMGKPVITSITQENLRLSGFKSVPFIPASEDTLGQQLRRVYEIRESLPRVGAECREFVLAHHDALSNARSTLADYRRLLERKTAQRR